MIAGEIEQSMIGPNGENPYYDHFLFKGKKKKKKKELTPEERAARREKRKKFWSSIGQEFREGGTIRNILGLFGADGDETEAPSDYQISTGASFTEPPKKKLPSGVMIVGGLVVLGIAAWGISQYQKNQRSSNTQSLES